MFLTNRDGSDNVRSADKRAGIWSSLPTSPFPRTYPNLVEQAALDSDLA